MNPKVSVLMPNYNCEKYIAEAIESILSQSFTDFEFIIIDDASTDRSWEIIQEYAKKDSRIIALRYEKNRGVQHTRNLLFQKAQGEYFALFDSDDIAHIDRLKIQVLFLDHTPDFALVGTNFDVIDANGQITAEKLFPEKDEKIRTSFFQRNPFGQNTVMMRAECIEKVGGYNPFYSVAEDLDLWVRIGVQYKMYNIQKKLLLYRVHGKNSILLRQKEMIRNTLMIRKNAFLLGYRMKIKDRLYCIGTWCMQFFPPKFVLWLSNILNKYD